MSRKLLEGHKPLDEETLDRFSLGPDNKLYLDDKKFVTQDIFESFKKAGWPIKVGAFIVGLTASLAAAVAVVNQGLEWNDRYCWQPRFYSSAAKCAGVATGVAPIAKKDARLGTPTSAPTELRLKTGQPAPATSLHITH